MIGKQRQTVEAAKGLQTLLDALCKQVAGEQTVFPDPVLLEVLDYLDQASSAAQSALMVLDT